MLQRILGTEDLSGSASRVYYQPPETIKLVYPCIIYELATIKTFGANNKHYKDYRKYTVTIIDRDPDSNLLEKVMGLPYCAFDRSFVSDDLNHFVCSIYI